MKNHLPIYVAACLLAGAAAGHAGELKQRAPTPQEAEFFESRVRPVLAEHCFSCHGPKKQKAGLRLDSPEALFKGSESGPVVVPGIPDKSPLVQAIRYTGDTRMPPKNKLPLPAIESLTIWVKMGVPWPANKSIAGGEAGAAWKRHWAFQAVRSPAPPSVHNALWPVSSIDRFVLAQLETKGLKPSAPADRRTLIRRATFDLLGLPPTPEEVAAFEADRSPDAFAQVVDRLLASPHYGERWGRYWLDVARYADTKGYVFFQESEFPWAYTYRDYVIRACNDDLPYDQFITQQLAADSLPLGPDKKPLTALGFLTLGGRFMNNEQDIIDDRIDVVCRGLMGLTVTCARCHDHKFDPIPSKDYYSLYGVFASCTEPAIPPLFEAPAQTAAYLTYSKELEKREKQLTDFVRTKYQELMKSARTRVAEYMMAVHRRRNQPNTEEFMLIADGNDLNPKMLVRWQNYLQQARNTHHPVFVPWCQFEELPKKEFAERARGLAAGFLHPTPFQPINPLVAKAFAEKPPKTLAEAAQRYGELLNQADKQWQDTLQRASQPAAKVAMGPAGANSQASAKASTPAGLTDAAMEELRQVFYGPGSPPSLIMLTYGDLDLLPDRASQAKLQELRKALETYRAMGPGAPPRAMVLQDMPAPYQPHVFLRGNPNNQGEAVPRQFVGIVAGPERRPFQKGSGRLELAQAIIDRNNPLTARVMVNRIWLDHFGKALVGTPADFGMRSDPPTHPELLDYLATTFMSNGWSVKSMHRLIMLSSVYQQRSDDRPECRQVDPENRLLWRMNRRRLDFEATRDAALAVSGHLRETLGGPPIKDFVAPAANRRTVYSFIDRLNLPGIFRTFDYPSPDATSSERSATTVPQQALFLMNNPFSIEQARKLLQRPEVATEKDLAKKIALLYRLTYGREPTVQENQIASQFLGNASAAPNCWERYAQALLMANEFVFVD